MNDHIIIRALLNCEGEVFRDIAVDPTMNLLDLSQAIVEAFELDHGQMGSFYTTDADWNQREEIPMMAMEPSMQKDMTAYTVADHLGAEEGKLIFIYDFLAMWTFMLEFVRAEHVESAPCIVLSHGERPEEAPEPQFEAEDFGMPGEAWGDDDEEEDPFTAGEDWA